MSYRSIVLSDYPIGYYPLDDLTTVDISNYTSLENLYETYQDILDDPLLSSYANIYGDIAYDHSGCENDAFYIVDPEVGILPILVGNSRSTKITNSNSIEYSFTKNYTASTTSSQFGTVSSSDNDFTIEAWVYPKFNTSNVTPLVGDSSNGVGLFYDNGNIVFKMDNDEIYCTVPYLNKVMHIVCTYSVSSASIYIDSVLQKTKQLVSPPFQNTSLSLKSGPTLNANDYFLINSVGVYRYALSGTQISLHYNQASGISPIQIVTPESGQLFEVYDNSIATEYFYSYPANRSWPDIMNEDLYYNQNDNSIALVQTESAVSSSTYIEDIISIPAALTIDSSKIDWDGDNGITVEVSLDGSTYVECINGGAIPGFVLNDFSTQRTFFIKITFESTDASKYVPKLYSLAMSFYNNQIFYSNNSGSYMTTLDGLAGVSEYEITTGNKKYPILSRDARNGIKTVQGSGFYLNTQSDVNTLEFFYTPYALTVSGLISTVSSGSYVASNYSWNGGGTISKTNISAIYVNGVNKTAETSVANIFKLGQMHHVVIVFTAAVSGQIKISHSSSGSVPALFQNLALYQAAFTSTQALDHYSLYTFGSISVIDDSSNASIALTESSVEYYDNDWVVVQNV
jgi:hypothetical protein